MKCQSGLECEIIFKRIDDVRCQCGGTGPPIHVNHEDLGREGLCGHVGGKAPVFSLISRAVALVNILQWYLHSINSFSCKDLC